VQSDVILLVRDPLALQTTGRQPGEFVDIEVLLSNWTFMGSPQWLDQDAQLSWTATVVGGAQIGSGTSGIGNISIAQGETGPGAAFGVAIPPMSTAANIAVNVTLTLSGASIAANDWTLAVFPRVAPTSCAVPVFAAPELLDAAQQVCSNAAAVPSSLTSQTKPFVLLRYGGLLEDDAAALSRVGGFGIALTPGSGSWPVCGKGSAGSVALIAAGFAQPWWMAGGMTGTLVYNTSLSATLGFVGQHNILDYGWATTVDGGQAYVLDGVAVDAASTVHIRAIPTDGVYSSMAGYGTTVSNSALLWEGRIPSADAQPTRGRFLVSGLNLFSGAALDATPVAEFTFGRIMSYAVSETTAGRAEQLVAAPLKDPRKPAQREGAPPCAVPGSFCVTGSDGPCQKATAVDPSANVCNKNFEIVAPVCLQAPAALDAIYPRLLAPKNGTKAIGIIYSTEPRGANNTFCSGVPNHSNMPTQLVAKGPITTVSGSDPSWVRLPMPQKQLEAGVYWIGALFATDTTCYGSSVPGKIIGPGATDTYAQRSFASGPGEGTEMQWNHGEGNFVVYATTRP